MDRSGDVQLETSSNLLTQSQSSSRTHNMVNIICQCSTKDVKVAKAQENMRYPFVSKMLSEPSCTGVGNDLFPETAIPCWTGTEKNVFTNVGRPDSAPLVVPGSHTDDNSNTRIRSIDTKRAKTNGTAVFPDLSLL